MPCNFPEHHSSGRPVGGWLAAVAAGALILVFWHAVLIAVAVAAALTVAGVAVLALWRSGRSAPYDAAWSDPEPPQAPYSVLLRARVDQLERQLAERRELEPAAVHQHLHLHGLSPADVASIVSQHAAIERD